MRTIEHGDQQSREQLNQKLQLCYLQLSQAFPLVISDCLGAFTCAQSPNFSSMSFTEAKKLHYAYVFQVFSDCLAHCFHFYLYVIFSKNFRNAFFERFARVAARRTHVREVS